MKNQGIIKKHELFTSSLSAEITAENSTSKIIDSILKADIKPTEYYGELFAAGYVLPAIDANGKAQIWPRNKKGDRLAATSSAVRKAVLEVNRLVSAFDGRQATKKAQEKKTALKALKTALGAKFPDFINENNAIEALQIINKLQFSDGLSEDEKITLTIKALKDKFQPVNDDKIKVSDDDDDDNNKIKGDDDDDKIKVSAGSNKAFEHDPVSLVEGLNGFKRLCYIKDVELSSADSERAQKLCRELIDLVQKA